MEKLIPDAGYNRLIKARYGYVLYNGNDTVVSRSVEYYGEYFESEVDIFRGILRTNDIAVDVGSNIGTHALAMSRLVGDKGRVIAAEPVRLTAQILFANAAINSLENLECFYGAFSDKTGFTDIGDVSLKGKNNYGGVSLDALPGKLRILATTLDDYFRYDRLRLIKVDVEGMEAAVLRGARNSIAKYKPALYVENDRLEKSEELLNLIEDIGYKAYWHLPLFHNSNNFFGKKDPIHAVGFFDRGEYLTCNGFAVNILCIPVTASAQINGLHPVLNAQEHPFKKECNPRFLVQP